MQMYAFVPMYVYYPSAGCWELIARVGDRTVRIVTLLKTEVAAASIDIRNRPSPTRPLQ